MPPFAALAIACLVAAAVVDLRERRVPNVLVAAGLATGLVAYPQAVTLGGAVLAPRPLLILAVPRFVGMGDVKFAAPIGVLLPGEFGLAAVWWWWAWALLGASVTLTVALVIGLRRAAPAVGPVAGAAPNTNRHHDPPLAPALLVAAAIVLATA